MHCIKIHNTVHGNVATYVHEFNVCLYQILVFCLDSIPVVGCDSLVAEAFCDNLPSLACVGVEAITCHHWHVWLLTSLAHFFVGNVLQKTWSDGPDNSLDNKWIMQYIKKFIHKIWILKPFDATYNFICNSLQFFPSPSNNNTTVNTKILISETVLNNTISFVFEW